ncbi:unnamed protein product [Paramecium sonneborni]|uniref:Uncharacterized protein n=1 Tax=Paramecium sonneborni TaxID=65129 RepID=A0A8S1JV80_9CILI|nr:unnamed protein product [Paramecium sonneborni]
MQIQINKEERTITKFLTDTFEHLLCRIENLPQDFDLYDIFIDNILYIVKRKTSAHMIIYKNCCLEFRIKKADLVIDHIDENNIRIYLDPTNRKGESLIKKAGTIQKQKIVNLNEEISNQELRIQQEYIYDAQKHVKLIRIPLICSQTKSTIFFYEIDQESRIDKVIQKKQNFDKIAAVFTEDDPNNERIQQFEDQLRNLTLIFDHHNNQVYWGDLLIILWSNGMKTVVDYTNN